MNAEHTPPNVLTQANTSKINEIIKGHMNQTGYGAGAVNKIGLIFVHWYIQKYRKLSFQSS
jgi:hypothetical protein